jgi:L,D-peptidoglycan transpeptidase YkuD (ErfK/YbiS/YcfS/YnhG family)
MSFSLDTVLLTPGTQSPEGVLEYAGNRLPCILGRGGIRADKREGDGVTPAGAWPLRRVLYRPDRLAPPSTFLPVAPLRDNDGWCDDPADPLYNRPVSLPYSASAEFMWRCDHLYDIVVVLGHNDDPVIPGMGSAIFMHLADPQGRPTAGCVALKLDDLKRLLSRCSPQTEIIIRP